MSTFKNACMGLIIAGSSLVTPGIVNAQTMTREQACEVLKRCAEEGCKFLPEHEPGFVIAFKEISFTPQERTDIENKFCSSNELMYFCIDNLVGVIMKDNSLSLAQKKALILRFCLKKPVSSDLVTQEAKYKEIQKKYYILAGDPTIPSRMEKYLIEEGEIAERGIKLLEMIMEE